MKKIIFALLLTPLVIWSQKSDSIKQLDLELFFHTETSLILLQPNNLIEGNAYAIRWESSTIDQIEILFSNNNGQSWVTIFDSVPAAIGIKNWSIPETSDSCYLKLVDMQNPGVFSQSQLFSIEEPILLNLNKYTGGKFDGYASTTNHIPYIEIISPAGGELWNALMEKKVIWNSKSVDRISILLSLDNGNSWVDTLERIYPGDAQIYPLIVPNTPSNSARIKLVDFENLDLVAVSEPFIIPEAYVNITFNFEQLFGGTPHKIFWQSSGIEELNLFYSANEGLDWDTIALNISANRGWHYWHLPTNSPTVSLLIKDANSEVNDLIEGIEITSLPAPNPTKYHGGSYDGYDMAKLDLSTTTCPTDTSVCEYSSAFLLGDATPTGGTFSGNGVTSNVFSPSIAGEGNHEITYHFTNFNGNISTCNFFIEVKPSQMVEVPNGWTGISSFLIPENDDITEMFTDMQNELVILYNLEGDVYYPGGNVYPANPWNMYSGYCLKSGSTIEMDFCGEYLEELDVELDAGWNLVPMLSKTIVSSDFIFGFNDDIEIVKQVAGWKVLWKDMDINTLGFVNPGKAYFVYCTAPTSISYPYYNNQILPEDMPKKPINSPFDVTAPTPVSHVIAFNESANGQLQADDIIAGFSQSGICCGQVQIDDENTSLTLFGDDTYSENPDGLMEAEIIQYRLYRPEVNRYFNLEISWNETYQAGNTFHAHGVSVATSIKLSGVGISTLDKNNINIYPNPTNGTLHISGIRGDYWVEVYNTVQEQVHQANLTGEAQLNLSPYPKGIYMLKITTHDYSYTEKVVLN
jgi:hypothetical protein